MFTLFCILGSSFGLGLLLTPLVRWLARCGGLVDRPDGRRKVHQRPTPVAGGIGVFFAAALAVGGAVWLAPSSLGLPSGATALAALLLASGVICVVGILDDSRGLRGRHKLLGQLVAVSIVLASGTVVDSVRLFDWQVHLGYFAYPFTAFWLLGAINSLNLIDGMDGLLGTIGTILCLAMAVLAAASGHMTAAAVAVALAGSLLAFLSFNFPPATIFLGDCGSMLVGLVVGVLALQSSLKAPATVALATPTALLIIPIFDTLAAITRRKLTGRSIYTTDRGHIHHCLLRSGLSVRGVLGLVSFLCLLLVIGVLASLALNNELLAVIAALTVVSLLIVRRLFGHVELILLRESVFAFLARNRSGQPTRQLQVRLQGSADWPELWQSLTECAPRLGLSTMCLDVNAPAIHEGYHARWDCHTLDEAECPRPWRAEIPLLLHGQVVGRFEVSGVRQDKPFGEVVAAVARLAEEVEQAVSGFAAASVLPLPPEEIALPALPPAAAALLVTTGQQ